MIVANCNAPTTDRYNEGSGSNSESDLVALQLATMGDAMGVASIILCLDNKSLMYLLCVSTSDPLG